MKKSILYKELIKRNNVKNVNLKELINDNCYFDDLEDFNKSINGKHFNKNFRNSVMVQQHDEYDLTIYDLDGYVLHEIEDKQIII